MIEKSKILVVLTTCPNSEVADNLARQLVDERLAACVNRVGGISSTYMWKDTVRVDEEVLLLIKTTEERLDAIKARFAALHPYELPELIAIPVCGGAENYLAWVRNNVKSNR